MKNMPKKITDTYKRQGRVNDGTFKALYDYGEPLTKQTVGVKLPISVAQKIKALPNSSEWLRNVIIEAAKNL